jgi:hypothetical protein
MSVPTPGAAPPSRHQSAYVAGDNVSPKAALSGNTLDATRTDAASAEFELIIVFKPQI